MKQWRDANTKYNLSVMARQLVRSVNNDLSQLNQSQRDMLAAMAMRDRGIPMEQAMEEFNSARSSLGFARTVLRFVAPQVSGLVLAGLMSVHKLDEMRREMGSAALAEHFLSMSDDEIRERYVSKRGIAKRRARSYSRKLKGLGRKWPYRTSEDRARSAAIRQFAIENGFSVGQRGRFSQDVLAAYAAANGTEVVLEPVVEQDEAPVGLPNVAELDRTAITETLVTLSMAASAALRGDDSTARELVGVARENLANM